MDKRLNAILLRDNFIESFKKNTEIEFNALMNEFKIRTLVSGKELIKLRATNQQNFIPFKLFRYRSIKYYVNIEINKTLSNLLNYPIGYLMKDNHYYIKPKLKQLSKT